MKKITYTSNNSGGRWWLKDEHWKMLEKAGWIVRWSATDPYKKDHLDKEGRWLGALATESYRLGLSRKMAICEWEEITGECAETRGCPCCGFPHNFYEDEADETAT